MPTLFAQIELVDPREREPSDRLARGHGAIAAAASQGARPITFRVGVDRA